MKTILAVLGFAVLLVSCGGFNSLGSNSPSDNTAAKLAQQIAKTPGDTMAQKQFVAAFNQSVLIHENAIASYVAGNHGDKWERVMKEYVALTELNRVIAANPVAAGLITTTDYSQQYLDAKENAAESLYNQANRYLSNNDRQSAMQAHSMLQKLDQLYPGYKDVTNLMDEASQKSRLDIVINPVNYYSHSYDYYGFNNDYVQYQFMNDLKYQLGSSRNIRVFTDREAYGNNIIPDRVIDLAWNELYMPTPIQQNFTREVSRKIVTGEDRNKQPVYTTVYATLYITQRVVQARGTLTCRIVAPATNETLLYESFPGGYNRREEYATYRGDSRALSSYDWAIVNNSSFVDPTRNSTFNEVLQQVYPQLINRIRSVTWYS